jgi:hypothetical protein
MSELEKAILEHPQIPMLRKAFIQDGLQTSVEGYLAHIGQILQYYKYEARREEMTKHDRELAETFIKFIATHLLKDFKEIMSKADFDEQTIKLFGRGE